MAILDDPMNKLRYAAFKSIFKINMRGKHPSQLNYMWAFANAVVGTSNDRFNQTDNEELIKQWMAKYER